MEAKQKVFDLYNSEIENVNYELGYSLTAKRVKSGWIVFKWYSRNSWVDDELERKVLITDLGSVFENNKLLKQIKL